MSGYIIPNIFILVGLAGIAILVARRLPEAERLLSEQGVSPKRLSRFGWLRQGWMRKITRFLLEGKGLYHPAGVNLRVRQLMTVNRTSQPGPVLNFKEVRNSTVQTKPKLKTSVVTPKLQVVRQPSPNLEVAQPKVASLKQSTPKPVTPKLRGQIQRPTSVDLEVEKKSLLRKYAQDLKLAKQLLEDKQYARARRILLELAPQFMEEPDIWARLGFAHYQINDYTGAVKAYEYALALDSNQPNRYYNLSLAYLALGNSASALKNIDKALVLDDSEKYRQAKQHIIAESTK